LVRGETGDREPAVSKKPRTQCERMWINLKVAKWKGFQVYKGVGVLEGQGTKPSTENQKI